MGPQPQAEARMLTLALPKSVFSFESGPQRLLALSELAYLIKNNINLSNITPNVEKLTLPKNPYKHTTTHHTPFQSYPAFIIGSNACVAHVP